MKKANVLLSERAATMAAAFMQCICYLLIAFIVCGTVLSLMGRQTFILRIGTHTYDDAIYAEKDHDRKGTRGPTIGLRDDIRVAADEKVDLITQVGISAMYVVQMAPVMFGFWFLAKLFRNIGNGVIFTEQNARYLLYYGLLQGATAIVVPLVKVGVCWLVNQCTTNQLSISTGQSFFDDLIPGVAFLVAAYIIRYGVHLQDEADHTL